jgi:regulator of protease activity HflC (stomatin/prohibitin superfamily)
VVLLASSVKIAGEHERAIIFRMARLLPELRGPGLFLVVPIIDRVIRVDLRRETPADAIQAYRFVGEEVVVEGADAVLLAGMPWPARSADGSTLITGEHRQVENVEDDLRLVVGSLSSPILEGQS